MRSAAHTAPFWPPPFFGRRRFRARVTRTHSHRMEFGQAFCRRPTTQLMSCIGARATGNRRSGNRHIWNWEQNALDATTPRVRCTTAPSLLAIRGIRDACRSVSRRSGRTVGPHWRSGAATARSIDRTNRLATPARTRMRCVARKRPLCCTNSSQAVTLYLLRSIRSLTLGARYRSSARDFP